VNQLGPLANQSKVEDRSCELLSVGDGIRRAITALGLDRKLREHRVEVVWKDVVGETISAEARIDRFQQGELVVAVEHDAWRHRLYLEKDTILKKLNQSVGENVVRSIRFRK